MRVVEIIPAHFVHTDCEHGLEARIDALRNQLGEQQLVDEKRCCMTVVENQGMPQRNRFFNVGRIAGQAAKQRLVAIERFAEIAQQIGT